VGEVWVEEVEAQVFTSTARNLPHPTLNWG